MRSCDSSLARECMSLWYITSYHAVITGCELRDSHLIPGEKRILRRRQPLRRRTSMFSTKRQSIPVLKNVSMACDGVLTIGWPLTLKLVFRTISRPVVLPTASRRAWNSGLSVGDTVCSLADPSTCVIAGNWLRYSCRTFTVVIIYGNSEPGATSN